MNVCGIITGTSSGGRGWLRIFGRGVAWKDTRRHRLIFSERSGHRRPVRVGPWSFKWLPAQARAAVKRT